LAKGGKVCPERRDLTIKASGYGDNARWQMPKHSGKRQLIYPGLVSKLRLTTKFEVHNGFVIVAVM
jgi:hypothetical protein